MENEMVIVPPEGYEIDKENSTFECIKFKPIIKKWRNNIQAKITGYYVIDNSIFSFVGNNVARNYNVFATEKQAKSALAMARISQIIANDERFGGSITDEEWDNSRIEKYILYKCRGIITTAATYTTYRFLAFHTKDQRDLFLKENEDLIKDYLMID